MRRTAWGGNTLVPDRTRCGCSEVQRPDKVQGRGKEEVGIDQELKHDVGYYTSLWPESG